MNTKAKVSVDADALRQVLAALVGPGHLIRELQAIRGLPSLGGVTHDPIGTLIEQFNAGENAEPACTAVSDVGALSSEAGSTALDAMRQAKDSLAEILASSGDSLIGLRDRTKEGDLLSDDAYDRASDAISALDTAIGASEASPKLETDEAFADRLVLHVAELDDGPPKRKHDVLMATPTTLRAAVLKVLSRGRPGPAKPVVDQVRKPRMR